MQCISSTEVEGKGAHLQQQMSSQGLQAEIAIKGELQNLLPPRGCNCASQTGKVCSASNQSARQGISTAIHPVQWFTSAGDDGKIAGPQNTCEQDFFRNRAHTAARGRFYNPPDAQVGLGRTTCTRRKSYNALIVNYLNISSSHMFFYAEYDPVQL